MNDQVAMFLVSPILQMLVESHEEVMWVCIP